MKNCAIVEYKIQSSICIEDKVRNFATCFHCTKYKTTYTSTQLSCIFFPPLKSIYFCIQCIFNINLEIGHENIITHIFLHNVDFPAVFCLYIFLRDSEAANFIVQPGMLEPTNAKHRSSENASLE